MPRHDPPWPSMSPEERESDLKTLGLVLPPEQHRRIIQAYDLLDDLNERAKRRPGQPLSGGDKLLAEMTLSSIQEATEVLDSLERLRGIRGWLRRWFRR